MSARLQVGGAVRTDAPYVERPADRLLPAALARGELCTILASRQIGKSSLRIRATAALRAQGLRVASVDLSAMGAAGLDPASWFYGLAAEMAEGLGLDDPVAAWTRTEGRPPAARWLAVLEEAVVRGSGAPTIVFLDEIDAVRALPFGGEDLFAAIRGAWDRRAEDPRWARLSFALLGVAAPADLIRDLRRTPFNVGRAIRLDDFTAEEARALLPALVEAGPDPEGLLSEILRWTRGHPYQTAQVAGVLVEEGPRDLAAPDRVEEVVARLYRGAWPEPGLAAGSRSMLEGDSPELLALYRRALCGPAPTWDPSAPAHAALLLTGLVARRGDRLEVRNPIVAATYNLGWIEAQQGRRALRQRAWAWVQGGHRDDDLATADELATLRAAGPDQRALDREESEYLLRSEAQSAVRVAAQRAHRLRAMAALLALLGIGAAGLAGSARREARLLELARGISDFPTLARVQGSQTDALAQAVSAWASLQSTPFAAAATRGLADTLDAVRGPTLGRGAAETVAALPDGATLVGRVDGRLERFDREGRLAQTWRLGAAINAVALGTDPELALIGTGAGDVLWLRLDQRTPETRQVGAHAPAYELKCQIELANGEAPQAVRHARLSPDGRRGLTVGIEGAARLWELANRGGDATVQAAGAIDALFSEDGAAVAVAGDDGRLRIFRVSDHQLLSTRGPWVGTPRDPDECEGEQSAPDALLTLANIPGRRELLVTGRHGVAQVLDWAGEDEGSALTHDGLAVTSSAASPDGQLLATGSENGVVRIWDTRYRHRLQRQTGHRQTPLALRFSADSHLLGSTGFDGTVRLLTVSSGQVRWTNSGLKSIGRDLAFSADGTVLTYIGTGGAIRYAVGAAVALDQWPAQRGQRPSDLSVAPDGTVAVAWTTAPPQILVPGGREDPAWPRPDVPMVSGQFSPQGDRLAWSSLTQTWLAARGGALSAPIEGGSAYWGDPWSPDGDRLVLTDSGRGLVSRVDGTLVCTLEDRVLAGLRFSPDGRRILAGRRDGKLGIYDAETGRRLELLGEGGEGLFAVAWSPDGERVSAVSSKGWSITRWPGQPARQSELLGNAMWSAWHDDTLLVVQRSGMLSAADARGQVLWQRPLAGGTVRTVALSRSTGLVAVASEEGSVQVWSSSGEELAYLQAYDVIARQIDFDANDHTVVTAGDDGRVYRLPASPEAFAALACRWLRDPGPAPPECASFPEALLSPR